MVEGIVKKIMNTGINKYAKAYEVPSNEVQIKVRIEDKKRTITSR
jgi:hypothetical protein